MDRWSLVGRTRWQMVAVAALSVAVVFLVFYLAWTTYTVRVRTEDLADQASVIATGIEAVGAEALTSGPTADLRLRFFRVQAGLIGATLAVTDEDGMILVSSRDPEEMVRDSYPVERLDAPDERGVRTRVTDISGVGRVLMVAVPIDGEEIRYLVALQPVRDIARTRGWVALLLLISAAVAVVVAWLVGGWAARRLTGPLVRLEQASEAVARGDWGHQVTVEGDDEVARLASAFNKMSARVASAYRAQKDFVGNVSHEMRTPVTTIAGFSAALVDGTVDDTVTRDRYLTVIHDEAHRLGHLSSVLLALADVDAGIAEPARDPVDLEQVAQALTLRYTHRAEEAGLDLTFEGLEGAVTGDEEWIVQALSTLVENAVHHTPAGGSIRVSCAVSGDTLRVVVEDSGQGIPPDDREVVFERFVRLDKSRSKDGGGSGLGLAICRNLLEAMGGRVWIEDSDLGGAAFIVELSMRH